MAVRRLCVLRVPPAAGHCVGLRSTALSQADTVSLMGLGWKVRRSTDHIQTTRFRQCYKEKHVKEKVRDEGGQERSL